MELTNDFEVKVPVDQAWAVLTDVERIAPCMPGAQLKEVEGDEYRGIVKVKVGPITAQYKGKATFVEKDDEKHVAVLKADGRDTRGQGNANAVITARLEAAGDDSTKVSVHTDLTVTGKVAQFGRGVMADVSAKLLDQFVENLETTVLSDNAASDNATSDADSAAGSADEPGEHVAEAEEEETAKPAGKSASPNGDEPPAAAASKPVKKAGTKKADAPVSEPAESPATPATDAPKATVRRIDHAESEPVDLLETAGMPVAKRIVPAIAVLVILYLVWRWLNGRDDG